MFRYYSIVFLLFSFSGFGQQLTTTSIELYYTSNYISRDDVSNFQAIQSTLKHPFQKTAWQFDLFTSIQLIRQSTDIEITSSLSYIYSFTKGIQFSHGISYYFAGNNVDDSPIITFEIYKEITLKPLFLSPVITIFLSDIGEIYTSFNFSHTVYIKKANPSSIYSTIGYRSNSGSARNGIREFVLGIRHPIKIKKSIIRIDGIVQNITPYNRRNITYLSIGVRIGL